MSPANPVQLKSPPPARRSGRGQEPGWGRPGWPEADPPGRHGETIATRRGVRLELEPVVDERLIETHKGRWEGRLREEVKRREPHLYRRLRRTLERFRFPGGEALAEHQRRVRAALVDVAAGPLPALLSCHVGTIRCTLALGHPGGLAGARELSVPNARPIASTSAGWAARRHSERAGTGRPTKQGAGPTPRRRLPPRWAIAVPGGRLRAMNPSLIHIAHADAVKAEHVRRRRRRH